MSLPLLLVLVTAMVTGCGDNSGATGPVTIAEPTSRTTTPPRTTYLPGTTGPIALVTSAQGIEVAAADTIATPPVASDAKSTVTPVAIPYDVVGSYPNDRQAWTQGFAYAGEDLIYVGTGDYENSSIRTVRLSTGEVLKRSSLPSPQMFGEGITPLGDVVLQLTWRSGVGLVFQADELSLTGQFSYPAPGTEQPVEGWGLTTDGTQLFLSDGTDTIYVSDAPATVSSGALQVNRQFVVTLQGQPVKHLNELEYINGALYANVWQTDVIVRIDPTTGAVTGVLDLTGLLPAADARVADVLNGIAFEPTTGHLLVTGKNWPRIYALELTTPVSPD